MDLLLGLKLDKSTGLFRHILVVSKKILQTRLSNFHFSDYCNLMLKDSLRQNFYLDSFFFPLSFNHTLPTHVELCFSKKPKATPNTFTISSKGMHLLFEQLF